MGLTPPCFLDFFYYLSIVIQITYYDIMVQKRSTIQDKQDSLEITSGVKSQFQEISRWALTISIIGFIVISLVLLAAIYSSVNMGFLRGNTPQGQFPPILTGICYLIVGILILIPISAIYKFGTLLKKALTDDDQSAMNLAFLNLKSGLRYSGMAIIALLTFVLMATYLFPFLEQAIF